jgi:DNA-directed RNA polymerase subunit RPC12/RpoP
MTKIRKYECGDCGREFILPVGVEPESVKREDIVLRKYICPDCVKINPWTELNKKHYTEEGIKDIEEIAEIVDKIGRSLTVDQLISLDTFIESHEEGANALSLMLVLKIIKLDRTKEKDYI